MDMEIGTLEELFDLILLFILILFCAYGVSSSSDDIVLHDLECADTRMLCLQVRTSNQ
jgi:hypothetical protein